MSFVGNNWFNSQHWGPGGGKRSVDPHDVTEGNSRFRPEVNIPEVSIPEVTLPDVNIPEWKIPEGDLPEANKDVVREAKVDLLGRLLLIWRRLSRSY